MDLLSTISVASGMAWASGMRLYAVVFLAGVFQRLEWVKLPGDLTVLANPWIIVLSGVLLLVEFLADKVPVIDSTWDAVHTFIRIPAGAALAAAAIGTDAHPALLVVATLLGGAVTATTHVSKASTRVALNTSPEPVSNVAASITEDGLIGAGTALIFLCSRSCLSGYSRSSCARCFDVSLAKLRPNAVRRALHERRRGEVVGRQDRGAARARAVRRPHLGRTASVSR
jgi:uncharacterized membrane protein